MLGLISVLKIICNVLKFKTIHSHYASFIFFNCLLDWLTDWLMRKTGHFLQNEKKNVQIIQTTKKNWKQNK